MIEKTRIDVDAIDTITRTNGTLIEGITSVVDVWISGVLFFKVREEISPEDGYKTTYIRFEDISEMTVMED